jgi:hypothetical protein
MACLAVLLALPFLLGLGCALVQVWRGPARPSFSHARHVKEKKLECQDCHADFETSDKAGMPIPEICEPCHKGKDEGKPPLSRADAFLKDGQPDWSYVTRLSDEVIFSHQVHQKKGVACNQCHRGIEDSTQVTSRLALKMSDCVSCHALQGVSSDCAVCHRTIRKEVAPESHLLSWQEVHGRTVLADRGARDSCNLCHTESQCAACHLETPPRSHTNFWRQRGHGVAVRVDREECRTCHQVDFCDRCHRETAPRNHTGSFASALETHCLTCHTPLRNEACYVCHKGTPGHLQATPMPASHNPAMNCRQCHGVGQVLPHVDNGSDCTSCHR